MERFKSHWEERARQCNAKEVVFGKTLSQEWSREKDKETFQHLQSYLEVAKNNRILDVGCGSLARVEVQYSKDYQLVGIDISRTVIKQALKSIQDNNCNCSNVNFIVADAESLPLQNQKFDTALCIGTICHLPTKQAVQNALHEMSRITKGKIFIPWWTNQFSIAGIEHSLMLPLFDLLHIAHAQYLRFNGLAEIQTIFQKAKLSILKIRYGNLLDLTWILNFSPQLLRKIIHHIMRLINGFHMTNRMFVGFSSCFEVTCQHNMTNSKAKPESYYQFL